MCSIEHEQSEFFRIEETVMLKELRSSNFYRDIKQLIFRYKEADLPSMSAQIVNDNVKVVLSIVS